MFGNCIPKMLQNVVGELSNSRISNTSSFCLNGSGENVVTVKMDKSPRAIGSAIATNPTLTSQVSFQAAFWQFAVAKVAVKTRTLPLPVAEDDG